MLSVIVRASRITGDVEYQTIAIETGASIDGRLKPLADVDGRTFERGAVPVSRNGDTVPLPSVAGAM